MTVFSTAIEGFIYVTAYSHKTNLSCESIISLSNTVM